MKDKKVTIEVTENGWSTTVEINGKTHVEKHIRTSYGSKCVLGDFEMNDELSDELYGSLTDFINMDIMSALKSHF